MKSAIAVVLLLIALPLILLSGLLLSAPMVSDPHMVEYAVVTDEMRLELPWHALVAVDAVRFQQDFGRVTRETIEETASLFSLCQEPGIRDWTVSYHPEERFERDFAVQRQAVMTWGLELMEGEVSGAWVLDEAGAARDSGSVLEPGSYRMVVEALPEVSVYRILISLESVSRCGPAEVAQVMDKLGLEDDDQQMALLMLATFLPPGEFLFHPNPKSPFHWPLEGPWRITSPYGYRLDPLHGGWVFHGGVDIGAPEGAPVRAADSGTVWFAGEVGAYGLMVRIDHGAFSTAYAHLSEIHVMPGQVIGKGDRLGLVGSTGKSTGPHLHLEWWLDESHMDPLVPFR